MNKERYLFVVSGPSGSGKDTVVAKLREMHPEIVESVSATTRDKRVGEKEGVNYYYKTKEQFELDMENGEILEYTQYCGNYYGTPKKGIDYCLENDTTVFLIIEVEGANNIKNLYPESTTIFVRPPSYEELHRRLAGRGTEDEETIKKRLDRAIEEMEYAADYDCVVVNEDVEECAEEIYEIILKRQK